MDLESTIQELRSGKAVAGTWHIEDVKSVRPDLFDDQCMQVLEECCKEHDADIGINWTVIEAHADELFPRTYYWSPFKV